MATTAAMKQHGTRGIDNTWKRLGSTAAGRTQLVTLLSAYATLCNFMWVKNQCQPARRGSMLVCRVYVLPLVWALAAVLLSP